MINRMSPPIPIYICLIPPLPFVVHGRGQFAKSVILHVSLSLTSVGFSGIPEPEP
jgi:hypothetical protein